MYLSERILTSLTTPPYFQMALAMLEEVEAMCYGVAHLDMIIIS